MKITANELRINNLVLHKNEVKRVIGIIENDKGFEIWMEDADGLYWKSSNVEGIPLTEEWLLKFGGRHVINNMFKLNNFIIKISEQGFYVTCMNERLFFRYVHDLQNWYYLTTKLIRGTGEELTIKETAK